MPTKPRYTSDVYENVHQSVQGLHRIGLMTDAELARFDEMCLPSPEYSDRKIQQLRKKNELTQERMALLLGVSVSTVRQWEQGVKKPNSSARRLLQLLEVKGVAGISPYL